MTRPDDIVGYTYGADIYCPEHIIEEMLARGEASPAARDMDTEAALDQIGTANAIDRQDERSFDSDDFPKVVFRDQAEDSRCGKCGEDLDT